MATTKQKYQRYFEKLYPHVNETEFEEYLENGMSVEGIVAVASKRRAKGAEMRCSFQKEKFSYVTEEEYKKLLDEGKSFTNIVSMNEERKQEVEQLQRKFSLGVNISFKPPGKVRVLLIGLSGEGKCSTACTLVNQEQGKRQVLYEGKLNGKHIMATILEEEEEHVGVERGINVADLCTEGIDAFLFVVNISNHRVLNQQRMIWDDLKRRFGYSFCNYCILVLTHAEITLRDNINIDNIYEIYTNNGNPFGQVMQELYPRIVAVDNLTSNAFFRRSQQETLWNMIDQLIFQTRRPYKVRITNDYNSEDGMLTEGEGGRKMMSGEALSLYNVVRLFLASLRASLLRRR